MTTRPSVFVSVFVASVCVLAARSASAQSAPMHVDPSGFVRVGLGAGIDGNGAAVRFDLSAGVRIDAIASSENAWFADNFRYIVRPLVVGSYEARPAGDRWLGGLGVEFGAGTNPIAVTLGTVALIGSEAGVSEYGVRVGPRLELIRILGLEFDYQYLSDGPADRSEVRALVFVDLVALGFYLLPGASFED